MGGPRLTIVVLGGSGFIGSSVVAHGRSLGMHVASLRAPRVTAPHGPPEASAEWWRGHHAGAFEGLVAALEPFDVVVNAAGQAAPTSGDERGLLAANAVLPVVVARAAHEAGVRRVVHVSTAAVQGRLDPLDETPDVFPLSPYARSKAQGEQALLGGRERQSTGHQLGGAPAEVVVYRPTSVHGGGRAVTRSLARLAAALPGVPVAGRGDRPAPVALVENVAAGVVFAATMPDPAPVVLQPWEGLTTRRLLELFGARRIVAVPERLADAGLDLLARSTARSARLTGHLRRAEVVVRGQGVRASALADAGFRPPFALQQWEELARA
ncbi:MAG TPA: NAD(P)-dependent oxidoreductase, partial [Acidimicrobiales bacterium]|nr:NAD(P)-dependent oxidoreductase [Acidimicrobiales bacterium]